MNKTDTGDATGTEGDNNMVDKDSAAQMDALNRHSLPHSDGSSEQSLSADRNALDLDSESQLSPNTPDNGAENKETRNSLSGMQLTQSIMVKDNVVCDSNTGAVVDIINLVGCNLNQFQDN